MNHLLYLFHNIPDPPGYPLYSTCCCCLLLKQVVDSHQFKPTYIFKGNHKYQQTPSVFDNQLHIDYPHHHFFGYLMNHLLYLFHNIPDPPGYPLYSTCCCCLLLKQVVDSHQFKPTYIFKGNHKYNTNATQNTE